MFLIRLVYASKISTAYEQGDIESITEASKSNNPLINVTGVLCYNNDYFLQVIEGSRVCVNQLYHKILQDKRHYDPAILQYEEITEREFDNWSMGYIPPHFISGDMVMHFSGDRVFNPYSMSGMACYKLIKALHSKHLTQ